MYDARIAVDCAWQLKIFLTRVDIEIKDLKFIYVYSKEQMKIIRSHIMKQNADLQEGISQAQSTARPLLTPKVLTTNESS